MSLSSRVLIFIAALIAVAVVDPPHPWGLLIAAAVYVLVVFPALLRR